MTAVRDRMTSPATTAAPTVTTAEALALLEQRGISALPIVEGDRLVGIVSTTDLVRDLVGRAAADGEPPRTAADCMRRPVVTAAPEESVAIAARRMVGARVHRLVVTERGAGGGEVVVGVLSSRDLLGEVLGLRPSLGLADVMTAPVETVAFDESIEVAVGRLAEANVHGLVVLDGESPVGVFTHAEALASRKLPPSFRQRSVEEVMSYETICLDLSTPIHRAAAHALHMNVRRLLVVDHRRLVGVLSCLDLVGVLASAG